MEFQLLFKRIVNSFIPIFQNISNDMFQKMSKNNKEQKRAYIYIYIYMGSGCLCIRLLPQVEDIEKEKQEGVETLQHCKNR